MLKNNVIVENGNKATVKEAENDNQLTMIAEIVCPNIAFIPYATGRKLKRVTELLSPILVMPGDTEGDAMYRVQERLEDANNHKIVKIVDLGKKSVSLWVKYFLPCTRAELEKLEKFKASNDTDWYIAKSYPNGEAPSTDEDAGSKARSIAVRKVADLTPEELIMSIGDLTEAACKCGGFVYLRDGHVYDTKDEMLSVIFSMVFSPLTTEPTNAIVDSMFLLNELQKQDTVLDAFNVVARDILHDEGIHEDFRILGFHNT